MKCESQFEHRLSLMLHHVHCYAGVSLPLALPGWELAGNTLTYVPHIFMYETAQISPRLSYSSFFCTDCT